MKKMKIFLTAPILGILLLVSCNRVSVPPQYEESASLPKIYPDYTEVTIPVNIAPLTFELDEAADDMVARYAAGDVEVLCAEQMCPSKGEWRKLIDAAKGKDIQVDVYAGAPWHCSAPDEQVCVLHTLVIHPAAKGRGLGRAFVAFYEDYARAHGCPALRIDTNARNSIARAFYKGLGYREIAVVPTTFNGIPGIDLVLLEKNLEAMG